MLAALCCAMLPSQRQLRESRGELTAQCRLLRTLTGRRDGKQAPCSTGGIFPKGRTQNFKGLFFFSRKVCSQGEREKKIMWILDGQVTSVSSVLNTGLPQAPPRSGNINVCYMLPDLV